MSLSSHEKLTDPLAATLTAQLGKQGTEGDVEAGPSGDGLLIDGGDYLLIDGSDYLLIS